MALVPCPDCGHQVSDVAPTCVNCGRPLRPQPAPSPVIWEYSELTVPLGFKMNSVSALTYAAVQYERIVEPAIKRAREEGWEPDGRFDFKFMLESGRLDRSFENNMTKGCVSGCLTFGLCSGSTDYYHYNSVRIPMRRQAVA